MLILWNHFPSWMTFAYGYQRKSRTEDTKLEMRSALVQGAMVGIFELRSPKLMSFDLMCTDRSVMVPQSCSPTAADPADAPPS